MSAEPPGKTMSAEPRKGRTGAGVIAFGVALSTIVSIDRVALALSRGRIAADLHLTDSEMGLVFSAYATAYAICEVPSGFLGDRSGPRRVLMRIAIWWSLFMAVTGRAYSFASLYFSQFFFGAGEAGCYPNIARIFSEWVPYAGRVRAQGLVWLSARWAGAFTPVLMALLFRYLSWRQAFLALAALGALWAASFHWWFRSRDIFRPVSLPRAPWGLLLRSKTAWLLCGQYLALVFPWYFLITWAPTFLDDRFHPDAAHAMWLKVLPLLFGGFGALTAGSLASPLARWMGSIASARRTIACIGFAGASAGLVVASLLSDPLPAVCAVAFSSFCNDLVMPIAWGTAADVGGEWSGTVAGMMNMAGNAGGALYGLTAGFVLQQTHHNWNAVLLMGAAVYLAGIPIWLVLDPETILGTPVDLRATLP